MQLNEKITELEVIRTDFGSQQKKLKDNLVEDKRIKIDPVQFNTVYFCTNKCNDIKDNKELNKHLSTVTKKNTERHIVALSKIR